ncbi:MAG: hypothetical protein OXI63_07225 [Candidatus Poribacteria bacterium]|nr:hypothetical protein [Candidatus Poribacteria bacterium]
MSHLKHALEGVFWGTCGFFIAGVTAVLNDSAFEAIGFNSEQSLMAVVVVGAVSKYLLGVVKDQEEAADAAAGDNK